MEFDLNRGGVFGFEFEGLDLVRVVGDDFLGVGEACAGEDDLDVGAALRAARGDAVEFREGGGGGERGGGEDGEETEGALHGNETERLGNNTAVESESEVRST